MSVSDLDTLRGDTYLLTGAWQNSHDYENYLEENDLKFLAFIFKNGCREEKCPKVHNL